MGSNSIYLRRKIPHRPLLFYIFIAITACSHMSQDWFEDLFDNAELDYVEEDV